MIQVGTNPEIRVRARSLLRALYDRRKAHLGRPVAASEFYPVRVIEVIQEILQWQIVEQRFDDPVFDIKGGCNFDTKTIAISDALVNGGQRTYTLAHEIAHAVLHSTDDGCPYGALRVASVRRRELHNGDPKALKRERDADLFAEELLMPEKAVRDQFETLFNRAHLWVGSRAVSEIYESRGRGSNLQPRLDEVARHAASYGSHLDKTPLCVFFGVSNQAMAIRLSKLRLIY
jgi:Zn-dependent peptidase ImmA (M78 family)